MTAMDKTETSSKRWHRLDNTANLFPVITSKRFSNVYRISLNLRDPVIPELLQRALETVLPWFAAFRVRLRKGVFWHYLEANPSMPTVREEDDSPCRYIDPQQNDQFLFRVTYFGYRINLEVFHVLTDGSGGRDFLLALCCQYLLLAHPADFTNEQKAYRWFAGHAADTEDSYKANYTPTKKSNYRIGKAFRLRGERDLLGNLSVIHAHMTLSSLKEACKEKNVSITQFITASMGWAVYVQQMKARPTKTPVNIFLPVNLRNMFESSTSLNFFSNIYVTLRFDHPDITFDDVLAEVRQQFEQKISKENILEKISYTVGSGNNPFIRVVPLPFKNIALRTIFEMSAKSSTFGFSNLGSISLPDPFVPFVSGTSLLLSCSPREPLKVAACSYGDYLTLSFTSTLQNVSLQRAMIRHFTANSIDITVESNGVNYETL